MRLRETEFVKSRCDLKYIGREMENKVEAHGRNVVCSENNDLIHTPHKRATAY